jgi:flagellar hook-length control protein FliK
VKNRILKIDVNKGYPMITLPADSLIDTKLVSSQGQPGEPAVELLALDFSALLQPELPLEFAASTTMSEPPISVELDTKSPPLTPDVAPALEVPTTGLTAASPLPPLRAPNVTRDAPVSDALETSGLNAGDTLAELAVEVSREPRSIKIAPEVKLDLPSATVTTPPGSPQAEKPATASAAVTSIGGESRMAVSATPANNTASIPLRLPDTLAPNYRLDAPLGHRQWAQELAGKVNLMIDRGEQVATLRLSPEHLGPIEVRIAVREAEAVVWFGATQSDTRQAIEQALPRLRDMLAGAGIALGQSTVTSRDPGHSQAAERGRATLSNPQTTLDDASFTRARSVRGIVDLYA